MSSIWYGLSGIGFVCNQNGIKECVHNIPLQRYCVDRSIKAHSVGWHAYASIRSIWIEFCQNWGSEHIVISIVISTWAFRISEVQMCYLLMMEGQSLQILALHAPCKARGICQTPPCGKWTRLLSVYIKTNAFLSWYWCACSAWTCNACAIGDPSYMSHCVIVQQAHACSVQAGSCACRGTWHFASPEMTTGVPHTMDASVMSSTNLSVGLSDYRWGLIACNLWWHGYIPRSGAVDALYISVHVAACWVIHMTHHAQVQKGLTSIQPEMWKGSECLNDTLERWVWCSQEGIVHRCQTCFPLECCSGYGLSWLTTCLLNALHHVTLSAFCRGNFQRCMQVQAQHLICLMHCKGCVQGFDACKNADQHQRICRKWSPARFLIEESIVMWGESW